MTTRLRPAISIDQWSILAGLRFFLASIVAVNHLGDYTSLGFLGFIPAFGSFEAILGFLLISGYSISVSYMKEPAGFLVRRLKRLYPIYLASIVITLCVNIFLLRQRAVSIGDLVLNALFLNQLLTSSSFVGPAWSLSLEFWLYCLAPALLKLRPQWTRALVALSFASYLLYTVCRTLFHLPYYSNVGYGANLLLLSYLWICGLRLARQSRNPWPVMRDIGAIFLGHWTLSAAIQFLYRAKHQALARFLACDLHDLMMAAVTLAIIYLVFSIYVVAPAKSAAPSRPLRFLGDISYPLYLIHMPVYIILKNAGLTSPFAYYLLALAASAGLYWTLDLYSRRRHL
jgi:peptidoglycan/LPS O-acetylase OafA/YrhL